MSKLEIVNQDTMRPGGGDAPLAAPGQITLTLLAHAQAIATSCQATAVFVYADVLDNPMLSLPATISDQLIYITKSETLAANLSEQGSQALHIPDVPLTRSGQVKIAIFLALSRNLIGPHDRVVFLSGSAHSGNLDTVMVFDVGREFEMLAAQDDLAELPDHIRPEVIERVIHLATQIGENGREGRRVGTIFVVGDYEHVEPLTRQLILNPFKGYEENQCNCLDDALTETICELASLDGAFIITDEGVIKSAGTVLKAASLEQFELPYGLGTRHHAAASITALTESIALAVSESTGNVTIFRSGYILTEIEKASPGES
jgi:DNA integrity scanning protein DisA with diadenylate cyclase activity